MPKPKPMLWHPVSQCLRSGVCFRRGFGFGIHGDHHRRVAVAHATTNILRRYHAHNAHDTVAQAVPGARYNQIGVQQISSGVYGQVFPGRSFTPRDDLVQLSRHHLAEHELLGKNTDTSPPVDLPLPSLQGDSLDEHFQRIGQLVSQPYLDYATRFATTVTPQRPRKWVRRSGWTKYNADMTTEQVEYPDEDMLSFDVETMWKETPFAVMACAASPTAWYSWLSPWLLGETDNTVQLIPLGNPNKERIIVGHNIGYDRARVKEEYSLSQSRNFFLDTMSLHVAVNGMCSHQRPTWMKHQKNRSLREKMSTDQNSTELATLLDNKMLSEEEEELWVGRSSINSLRDVAKFHTGVTIDKARRDYFGELDRHGICDRLEELLDYCAADVDITHKVYCKVFPNFLQTCPHPVNFGALRHLSSVILPVNETWDKYLESAEKVYVESLANVEKRLSELADAAIALKDQPEAYTNDPWLNQLDWSGQEIKYTKPKKKGDLPQPAKRQKKPGMPKWYKDLFMSNDAPINLTVRTRIAPILLKLQWDGYPLVWSDKNGWTFRVPVAEAPKFENGNVTPADFSEEENLTLKMDRQHAYFKMPHKDGPSARCASPLAKGYLQYFESGKLTSQFPLAKEALEMNASCSYWMSARDRIKGQLVVKESQKDPSQQAGSSLGYILPQVIPMGTITRRAVENTWLTASNAKKNRVGSELKAMVKAPPGYVFVGADVDSEELWIASLMGDAQFQLHGGNAIGFMTLEGTKAAGTDLHSRTAKTLGISRNDAKVFNYGRIYGAGLKFASTLLRQFNPNLTEEQTTKTANELYQETKGTKTRRKALADGTSFWRGGTESLVFNKLEEFAEQERPRTPVLGAGITEALMRRFISHGAFMTSRINWAIQSSGVDYLHLLITSMDYLTRRFNIDARVSITVHDEIRYLVKEEDKYRAAMALQVSNLWTRAMFSQQVGIDDLPQSCAFFSAVDIDFVLRKEVDMDCVTPSNPTAIPPGESLDMMQLLAKGDKARLDLAVVPNDPTVLNLETFPYTPRTPVIQSLPSSQQLDTRYLRAQLATNDAKLKAILQEIDAENKPKSLKKALTGNDDDSNGGQPAKPATRRGRPRKPRVPEIPAHAQPQRAVLMEVQDRWLSGQKNVFAKKTPLPWWAAKKPAPPTPSWSEGGWEV